MVKETWLDFGELTNRKATDKIVIHHVGGANRDFTAQEIHGWHKNQGWSGVGYHYVIRKDGTVERGRPHWTIGAHAEGENWHTIGINVAGDFDIGQPEQAQIEALSALCADICSAYRLSTESIVGHRDVGQTSCPGKNLYDLLQTIRGKVEWYLHNKERDAI